MVAKTKKPAALPVPVEATPAALAAPAPLPAVSPESLSFESFAEMGRENLAAVAKSNLALSEGLGAIGEELFAYAKTALASASQTATALLGAKTLEEVIELNSDLAKTTMETLIARSSKLGELGIAATNQALAPLGGRFEATIATLTRPAA